MNVMVNLMPRSPPVSRCWCRSSCYWLDSG